MENQLQTAYFASGCFWCTEAVFKALKGVEVATSGYAGGNLPNPTYEQVCLGSTGHAETVEVKFNPSIIPYEKLAEVFFLTHDPTTLNRQGNDVGEQYRSAIFYTDASQRQKAEQVKAAIAAEKVYPAPIVTQVVPFTNFFPAESSHQNYYNNNPQAPYCQVVINPKIAKFRQKFTAYLK